MIRGKACVRRCVEPRSLRVARSLGRSQPITAYPQWTSANGPRSPYLAAKSRPPLCAKAKSFQSPTLTTASYWRWLTRATAILLTPSDWRRIAQSYPWSPLQKTSMRPSSGYHKRKIKPTSGWTFLAAMKPVKMCNNCGTLPSARRLYALSIS